MRCGAETSADSRQRRESCIKPRKLRGYRIRREVQSALSRRLPVTSKRKIMRPHSVLRTLFRHNLWANLGLVKVCSILSDEQLQTGTTGGFGSIGDTLQHIVRSEESYIHRIRTGNPIARPDPVPQLSFDEMIESLRRSGEGLIEWADKVQATDSVKVTWKDGQLVNVPKAVILVQAINHATEHRVQIMTILTQLGIEPPELSGWAYYDAQGFE